MSLSQKFSGLVLVPWFNKMEWDFVYEFAYSKDRDKQSKALSILKEWKLRTPILSTGVEGTMILLEALLLDTEKLSQEHVAHLYAIALMRFLNLSAANSDKQGSFAQTSAKNELPKWLINLRHDIAHGHQIPSVYNLKMGLDFGFQWLCDKYWEPQSSIIKDYDTSETPLNQDILYCFNGVVDVIVALLENQQLESVYMDNLSNLVYDKLEESTSEPSTLLTFLLKILEGRLKEDSIPEDCFHKLVSDQGLLKLEFLEMVEDVEDEDTTQKFRIQTDFKGAWIDLLNVLHKCGLLFSLIERLADVLMDISISKENQKMAALWIQELFCALLLLNKNEVSEDTIQLEESENFYKDKLEHFGKTIISHPNPFISYFLDSFLAYSDHSTESRNNIQDLLRANVQVDTLHQAVNVIHLSDDLPVSVTITKDNDEDQIMESDDVSLNSTNINSKSLEYIYSTSKWQRIKDTSAFVNCPFGVLPHQIELQHPFIQSF